MKISSSTYIERYHLIGFVVLLLLTQLYLDYFNILFFSPQSIHQWRQTDCLSLTSMYFHEKAPFFQPKMHHIYGNDGKTVGEFPILYYITSQFYRLFGEQEFILRGINLLLFNIGIIYIYKTAILHTRNLILSAVISLLVFCSPILAYYGNNFLTDGPSLGIVFISWYFYYKYFNDKNLKFFVIATILITIAGLLKTTALITAGSVAILMLIQKIRKEILLKHLIISIVPFILCGAWIGYANYYKAINETFYLIMKIKPIWGLDTKGISKVWTRLSTTANWGWRKDILPSGILYLSLISIPIFGFLSIPKKLMIFTFSALSLSLIYLLLMYPKLYHHDYYLMHAIPFLLAPFVLIVLHYNKKILIQLSLVVLVLLGINYTKSKLQLRYTIPNELAAYIEFQKTLTDLGIGMKEKIISISDNTYCASLYTMNRRGWTNLSIEEGKKRKYIIERAKTDLNGKNAVSKEFNQRIRKGASFLIAKKNDEILQYIPSKYKEKLIFADSLLLIYKLP